MPPPRRGAVRRWREGLEVLAERDGRIRAVLAEVGTPPMALRGSGFAALLRAIAAQQVSAASARAIWARLEAATGGRVTTRTVLALGPGGLCAAGLSRPKAGYALAIAEELVSGRISLRRIARMPDEEAVVALSALRGVGRWTAEVWLLFAMGRPDIWPAADLALCVALQRTLRLDVRPTPAEAARLVESWSPHRSASALLHWHVYRTAPS
ncbi:MAG: DNA-3-methyladenine glycosylase 2 family protein [Alphaproteobacteria bacterium]|nr:DNA-3-methyladenine glycosylase 2 family protein [Alphaproteobacteria bacterium]MCY4317721.1 DNA-3-methyladenine glycosylase 2 family protein [Alphaproteobacteria bacterium]